MMIKFSKSTTSCGLRGLKTSGGLRESKTCFVSQKAQQVVVSKSAEQTQKIGRILGEELKNAKLRFATPGNRRALVIGLEGDLGGGKTTFVQGLAQGLKIKEPITSPSFVLIKRFRINSGVAEQSSALTRSFASLFHIDCYRLNKPQELQELDFEKIIKNPKNLVVIEWVEKVREILPKERIKIKFEWISENKRRITMNKEQ